MEQKIIEGTWEEIARRGGELAGRRVRLTVLDELSTPSTHEGVAEMKSTPEDLVDHEFIAYCTREADDSVTLEEVLEATSKIKDSMARVIIEEERAERF